MGKLFAEMKAANLTLKKKFLLIKCVLLCLKRKKLGELLNVMHICQEKKTLILGKIDNHIRIAG